MKFFLAVSLWAMTTLAGAASIPTNLEFPIKNSPTPGATFRMADYPNDVFVFEAFTVSCGTCGENAPAVNRLADEYKTNPRVHVIDLGQDTTELYYKEWVRRFNPNHIVVSDVKTQVFETLHTINQTPQVFVVNCDGTMVGNHVGAWRQEGSDRPNGEAMVRLYIEKALKTKCKRMIEGASED
jgi:hypothetical protein